MTDQEICGACDGSRRMPRDPDIGTDQECFVCDGSGVIAAHEAKAAPAVPQGGFGISAHQQLAGEVIVLLGAVEDDLDALQIQDWQMPLSVAQWGKVAHMADIALKPPQEPVTLTDEEIDKVALEATGYDGFGTQPMNSHDLRNVVHRAIAALREKGGV